MTTQPPNSGRDASLRLEALFAPLCAEFAAATTAAMCRRGGLGRPIDSPALAVVPPLREQAARAIMGGPGTTAATTIAVTSPRLADGTALRLPCGVQGTETARALGAAALDALDDLHAIAAALSPHLESTSPEHVAVSRGTYQRNALSTLAEGVQSTAQAMALLAATPPRGVAALALLRGLATGPALDDVATLLPFASLAGLAYGRWEQPAVRLDAAGRAHLESTARERLVRERLSYVQELADRRRRADAGNRRPQRGELSHGYGCPVARPRAGGPTGISAIAVPLAAQAAVTLGRAGLGDPAWGRAALGLPPGVATAPSRRRVARGLSD